jgi:hypothetical protein
VVSELAIRSSDSGKGFIVFWVLRDILLPLSDLGFYERPVLAKQRWDTQQSNHNHETSCNSHAKANPSDLQPNGHDTAREFTTIVA